MSKYVINRHRRDLPDWDDDIRRPFLEDDPACFHRTLPGYQPTPLVVLPGLAAQLGVGEIRVKDESHRLGLKAFKVLGASYAIYKYLRREWVSRTGQPFGDSLELTAAQREFFAGTTFCTATDGNHGRAVAWTARLLGLPAVIYMPGDTVPARVENIRREGARVEVIDGTYDRAVERIREDSERHGWTMISDTSWPGYSQIPQWIQAAYTTMFAEMEDGVHHPDDHGVDLAIIPGGVGALAAGVAWYYVNRYGANRPGLLSVEPTDAACLLESAATDDARPVPASGALGSIMAGLNCGVPSMAAWPLIRDSFDAFISVEDHYARDAMRRYYRPAAHEPEVESAAAAETGAESGTAAQSGADPDPLIESGESGAATLAALLALMSDDGLASAREHLQLGPDSRILLLNTEGATDPENFARIVGE